MHRARHYVARQRRLQRSFGIARRAELCARADADGPGSPEDVLKGFAAGADDYLPKPFDLSILLARLQGLLRRTEWMRTGHAVGNPEAAAASDPGSVSDFGIFSFDGKTIDFGRSNCAPPTM